MPNEIKESSAQMPLLGYTVIASLDSGLEISFADLRSRVTPLGFGAEELLPPEPEPRTYIRRGITAWLKEIATSGTGTPVALVDEDEETGRKKKPLVREIKSRDKTVLVLALVKENIDLDALGLSYLTNLRVFYVKPSAEQPGTLVLTLTPTGATDPLTYLPNGQEEALLKGLQRHVSYYSQTYKSTELGRMTKKIIESMAATNLRPTGGTYFVPYGLHGEGREKLMRLKALIEEKLPTTSGKNTSSLLHIPIVDEANSKAQVAESAHKTFVARADEFEKQMQRVLTDAEHKKRGIRKDLMEKRIVEMEELRTELDLYNRLLGVQRGEIEARLDAMEAQAGELIGLYAIGVKREREAARTQAASVAVEEDADEEE